MKKLSIFLLFILFFISNSYSQVTLQNPPITANGLIVYSLIDSSSISPDAAFINAKKWVAKSFGDYNSVVKLEDNQARTLILKGKEQVQGSKDETLDFTLEMNIKDKKYRLMLSDISLASNGSTIMTLEGYYNLVKNRKDKHADDGKAFFNQLHQQLKNLLVEVSKSINKADTW